MMHNAWTYILRLALSVYYVYLHLPPILEGAKDVALGKSIFSCTSELLPPVVAYNVWHGAFLVLAGFILFYTRPVVVLAISLVILLLSTYLSFSAHVYDSSMLLLIISILLNVSLLIIYGRRGY